MLDEGLAASLRSRQMDPSAPWPYWGSIRLLTHQGDFHAARETLDAMRARFNSLRNMGDGMVILTFEDRPEEVAAYYDQDPAARSTGGGLPDIALALIRLGRGDEAMPLVNRCERFAAVDMDQAANAAAQRAHLGQADAAFRHLDRAVALGNDCLTKYLHPVFFSPLYGDPRWEPFIEGVRARVAGWRRDFRWPPPGMA
jgi:hypothetical protein